MRKLTPEQRSRLGYLIRGLAIGMTFGTMLALWLEPVVSNFVAVLIFTGGLMLRSPGDEVVSPS